MLVQLSGVDSADSHMTRVTVRQFLKLLTPPLALRLYRQTRQWALQSIPGHRFPNNSRIYKAKKRAALTRLCAQFCTWSALPDLPSLNRAELAYIDERIVEYPWVLRNLAGGQLLLDVGCVLNYDFCVNLLKAKYKQVYFQNLVPQSLANEEFFFQIVQDIRVPMWYAETFDAITCISTLEHVGMDNVIYTKIHEQDTRPGDYIRAVEELIRIVRPGGQILITVPFGRPDNLGWIQVFGPEQVHQLLNAIRPHRATVEFFRSSPQGWQRASQVDCEQCVYGQGVPAAGAIAALAIFKNDS
jgi:SAM-dependent methyltransferase